MTVVELRFVTGVHSLQDFCVESVTNMVSWSSLFNKKNSLQRFGMQLVVPFTVEFAFNLGLCC